MLVGSPAGGRGPLSADESLDAFKSALLTRERIVTEADLRHFLAAELGANLKQMRLSKQYRPSRHQNGGFEKVLRVDISLPAELAGGGPALKQQLTSKIHQASSGLVAFDLALQYA